MLRVAATTEVDSSQRRFLPHFRPDTVPTRATSRCALTPPQVLQQHLSLRRRTTGFPPVWRIYSCRRFSRDSCRVQWVLSSARRLSVLFSSVAIYLSLRTDRATARLSSERVILTVSCFLPSLAESCARRQLRNRVGFSNRGMSRSDSGAR